MRLQRHLEGYLTPLISALSQEMDAQATWLLDRHAGVSQLEWKIILLLGVGDVSTVGGLCAVVDRPREALDAAIENLAAGDFAFLDECDHCDGDCDDQALFLTASGEAAFRNVAPVMRARQERFLTALTEPERETLVAILAKLQAVAEERVGGA